MVFTAPVLPEVLQEDFTFYFTADVENAKGDYFANMIRVSLKSGESKKVYFLILSFQSLSTIQTTVGTLNMMPTLTSPLAQTFIFNILGVATYVFPAFSFVVLIAAAQSNLQTNYASRRFI